MLLFKPLTLAPQVLVVQTHIVENKMALVPVYVTMIILEIPIEVVDLNVS